MNNIKEVLHNELLLKNDIRVDGIDFDAEIFRAEIEENEDIVQRHACMDYSTDDTKNIEIPREIRFEHGIGVEIRKNSKSDYKLKKYEDGIFVVKGGRRLSKIYLPATPEFYKLKTSDGVSMKSIAGGRSKEYGDAIVNVTYSNECALRDKGKDCLFCNINATKDRFGEKEDWPWKTPKQIAETVKAAFDEGYNHFNLSGGFIPERRELEYYLDTGENICDILGTESFNGTAVVGAPKDLSIIEKYKEAGFSTLGLNLEVWTKDFFNAICPGKAEASGGYENWLAAIDYALAVFGKGKVRVQFVAGLQPKEQLLEGIETLAEKGAVTVALTWFPNIGSAFEGHRSPTPEWHWDLQTRIYAILKKNGRTFEEVYNATPSPRLIYDFYRIDSGFFPIYPEKINNG